MNVEIGEITSTVRATDSAALLDPRVIEQLVRIVKQKIKDAHAHEERVKGEQGLRPAVSSREGQAWN